MYRHGEYIPAWKHREYYEKRSNQTEERLKREDKERQVDRERGYSWTPGGGRISE